MKPVATVGRRGGYIHLDPGVFTGSFLGSFKDKAGYIIEISPITHNEGCIDRFTIQPEFDGCRWNDVVRAAALSSYPAFDVNVRVYRVGSKAK